MAEVASNAVTFDIIDGHILESDDTILDNLTDEEHIEVTNVITLLESAEEDSLQHSENVNKTQHPTKKHSSRMRTANLATIRPSLAVKC